MFGAGLLVLAVLCVSVIGDALRDAIDPSSGSSRL
jgi:ABC-type dipeptide/oligopeptide/nickel transport system permease subunit